jgi:hypothetical protein
MALFMQMIYSKYEVNGTSTFKVIVNINFHIKVGGQPDAAAGARQ